jgi:hypothetical protein
MEDNVDTEDIYMTSVPILNPEENEYNKDNYKVNANLHALKAKYGSVDKEDNTRKKYQRQQYKEDIHDMDIDEEYVYDNEEAHSEINSAEIINEDIEDRGDHFNKKIEEIKKLREKKRLNEYKEENYDQDYTEIKQTDTKKLIQGNMVIYIIYRCV